MLLNPVTLNNLTAYKPHPYVSCTVSLEVPVFAKKKGKKRKIHSQALNWQADCESANNFLGAMEISHLLTSAKEGNFTLNC